MAISLDLRQRILQAYEQNEGSIRQLAKRFKVGFATIWRLLKKHRTQGTLAPGVSTGRKSKIDEKGLGFIDKLLIKNNDLTLQELCEAYQRHRKVTVSITAMHRACERLRLRYKKNRLSDRTTT